MPNINPMAVESLSSAFLRGNRHHHNAVANQILHVLKAESIKRNSITLQEFRYYARLFDVEAVKQLTEDQQKALGQEWASRIDPYEPVRVFNSLNDPEPLFTLPPIWTRIPAVNIVGIQGALIDDGFTKYANDDNPASIKPLQYRDLYMAALKRADHLVKPYYEQKQQEFNDTMEDLKKKNIIPSDGATPNEESQSSTVEYVEEPL